MTIIEEQIIIVTPLGKIRRRGVIIRQYENTDSFANVAQWAATDFADCGEEGVSYFREQDDLPNIAIHGNHVHVLVRKNWELVGIDQNEAKGIVIKFKNYLKTKGIEIKE
jgi:hypothetical protein